MGKIMYFKHIIIISISLIILCAIIYAQNDNTMSDEFPHIKKAIKEGFSNHVNLKQEYIDTVNQFSYTAEVLYFYFDGYIMNCIYCTSSNSQNPLNVKFNGYEHLLGSSGFNSKIISSCFVPPGKENCFLEIQPEQFSEEGDKGKLVFDLTPYINDETLNAVRKYEINQDIQLTDTKEIFQLNEIVITPAYILIYGEKDNPVYVEYACYDKKGNKIPQGNDYRTLNNQVSQFAPDENGLCVAFAKEYGTGPYKICIGDKEFIVEDAPKG